MMPPVANCQLALNPLAAMLGEERDGAAELAADRKSLQ